MNQYPFPHECVACNACMNADKYRGSLWIWIYNISGFSPEGGLPHLVSVSVAHRVSYRVSVCCVRISPHQLCKWHVAKLCAKPAHGLRHPRTDYPRLLHSPCFFRQDGIHSLRRHERGSDVSNGRLTPTPEVVRGKNQLGKAEARQRKTTGRKLLSRKDWRTVQVVSRKFG